MVTPETWFEGVLHWKGFLRNSYSASTQLRLNRKQETIERSPFPNKKKQSKSEENERISINSLGYDHIRTVPKEKKLTSSSVPPGIQHTATSRMGPAAIGAVIRRRIEVVAGFIARGAEP